MSRLDDQLDELYRRPLNEFVSARTALAKTLTGAEAAQVKKAQKPTVVPWAVNQLYWHERPAYDRLLEAGRRLRAAQIAALKGRASDVREAATAHREALRHALAKASELAEGTGAHPAVDDLTKTLEAVSLAAEPPEPPGRLTHALQPAGFEALAGVPVAPRAAAPSHSNRAAPTSEEPPARGPRSKAPSEAERRKAHEEERRKQKELAAAARRLNRAVKSAEERVARAQKAESRAADAWRRAKADLADAERALADIRR